MRKKEKLYKTSISIAGLCVSIDSADRTLIKGIEESSYGLFISKSRPIFKITIKKNPSFKGLAGIRQIRMEIIPRNKDVVFLSPAFGGKIDLIHKRVLLEHDGYYDIDIPLFNCLRTCLSILLLDRDGLIMHSANLIKNNKGYLFFGKSGSGKSTVARSARETSEILNDETTIIRRGKGNFRVYGSPLWGMMRREMDPINKSALVKGAFKLVKSDHNSLERLDKKHGFLELATCMSCVPKDKRFYKKALNILHDFINTVPVYKLYFTKECDFWHLIK